MPAQANIFNLRGSHLHIRYSTGAQGSKATLVYHNAHANQTIKFDEQQLRRASTELGEEVTVTINQTPDLGSTTFTLLVPRVLLDINESIPIETISITTIHNFSIAPSLNHGVLDTYSVAHLHGSASLRTF